MKNLIFLIFLFVTLTFSLQSFSEENWQFVKDVEYCFIQSNPIKTDIPEGKSRGEYGILVYTMHKNPDLIIQITAGFNYKSSTAIEVKIDQGSYEFYTDADTAWAKNDKKVIFAMKKGLELVTTGFSSKGTKVIDTYTLKGFTSAVNKLSEDC
jgi:hypothetical protein